ncbi:Tyrosine recombinase XerC [subsurface metagenome]
MGKRKLPIILDVEEGNMLLKVPSTRCPTGVRNKAIMSLMLFCGLKLSEVVNLKPRNINFTEGVLRIINIKFGKDREIPMSEYTQSLLRGWKEIRPKGGYYFTTLKGGKISPEYIEAFVQRYSKKAGIHKKISPQTLRHSYATEFYRRTKDIEALKKVLGHAYIDTTNIYITLANIEIGRPMKTFSGFNA